MRTLIITIITICSISSVMGQENLLKRALDKYQAGELIEAKNLILKCTEDDQFKSELNTWYLQGFIMKDLYNNEPESDSALYYRLSSQAAFEHLVAMPSAEKYIPDALKNFKYLSSTFYNDAISSIESGEFKVALEYYQYFVTALKLSKDVSINLNEQKISFLLALGSGYTEAYKSDTSQAPAHLEGAKTSFQKVLEIDEKNIKANYNIGVLYYNEAVNLIKEMDYDEVDLIAFSQLESQSIELFKQSLPYMELAYQQNPNDKNTIEGLAGIYFSLRDYEKSNEFKEKLESLSEEK